MKTLTLDVPDDQRAHLRGIVAFDETDAERRRGGRRNHVARQRACVAARDAADGESRQEQAFGQ
jgi:hypothetical protein